MAARNSADSFGWITRVIHWLMALGLLGALGFGAYLSRIEPSFSNLWMYGAHKSVGIVLLVLVLVRILWHRLSPPPHSLTEGIAPWQISASRWAHRGLYALMLIVPLSGWIGSSATGINVVVFGAITLPNIAPASERWDEIGFLVHDITTKLLMLVIMVHVAGALSRHFGHKDATLRRMLRGR